MKACKPASKQGQDDGIEVLESTNEHGMSDSVARKKEKENTCTSRES